MPCGVGWGVVYGCVCACSMSTPASDRNPSISAPDCTGFLNFVDWSQNDAHPMSFGASDTTLSNVLNMRNQECGGVKAIQAAASMFVTWTHFGQRDEVGDLASMA